MPLTVLTTLGVIGFMPLKKVNGNWRMYVPLTDADMLPLANSITKGSSRPLISSGFS
jgi:hypothetical protein